MKWKVLASIAAVLVIVWFYNFPRFSWYQRITVEVMVDGELVSGSSVTLSRVRFSPNWFPSGSHRHPSIEGEAVVVDLGERGMLFALLRSEGSVDYTKSVAMRRYREIFFTSSGRSRGRGNMLWSPYNTLADQRDERVLPHNDYPMLVTFTDIDDPTSVQLVDPDDLAATFGEGVNLNRITLAITGDGVTRGIEDVLGWLTRRGRNIDGTSATTSRELSNVLDEGDFHVLRR